MRPTAERYGMQNETINKYLDGDTEVWIVKGEAGRRVVLVPIEEKEKKAYAEMMYETFTNTGGNT